MSSHQTAWVGEPNTRGTWGLIESCLLTSFLCIYTAIHLNVRPHQTKKQWFFRHVRASLFACALPELMFIWAASQYGLARRLQSQLNSLPNVEYECERCQGEKHHETQDVHHGELQTSMTTEMRLEERAHANPNGDALPKEGIVRRTGTLNLLEMGPRDSKQDFRAPISYSYAGYIRQAFSRSLTNKDENPGKYTIQQAFFIVAGGLGVATGQFHKEDYLTVTPAGAIELARLGLLDPVREDVIAEKTKADYITKVIVLAQASWFIIQCLARLIAGLPLTLLEIHIVSHVFIALLMYMCWFSKPYNVSEPIVMTDQRVIETAALFTLHANIEDVKLREKRCVLKDPLDVSSLAQLHKIDDDHLRRSTTTLAQRALQRTKANNVHFVYYESPKIVIQQRSTFLSPMLPDLKKSPGDWTSSKEASMLQGKKNRKLVDVLLAILPSEPWSTWVYILFISIGAFHLSAWNADFPTPIERWMWRAAGLAVVGLPVEFVALTVLSLFSAILIGLGDSTGKKNAWRLVCHHACYTIGVFVLFFTHGACFLCVSLGRLFLLVEAFASLRRPPMGTYQTVSWTQGWPHA